MQRTRALILAGTVAAVTLTGAAAVAANTGLLGGTDRPQIGTLTAVDLVTPTVATSVSAPTLPTAPSTIVRYVDVVVTEPAVPAGSRGPIVAGGPVRTPSSIPSRTVPAGTVPDRLGSDDDHLGSDDDHLGSDDDHRVKQHGGDDHGGDDHGGDDHRGGDDDDD